ncbi:TPA_exp: putative Proline utilization protein PrnX [Trichophyton benhamiae CBS 112371]|uniref:Proline utilization protein PrnX, putative n=2 Tax=Trichophyton TaxID=5550 RepID=D4B2V1_ARTBC|nr:proline utilization protein PrnX, putative [Trichophyton benhamiae CBS 112371]XP_003022485.1 proline utilization protein PrnX, putative [Trichophyton verrucosum HKI 0517]EFE30412.1 proline utilization protein PrnX, putative [Trichophyton benhamiae CBS 112371]EFE41867.1 proline utilization protein PrnX, putative [Trichophyton verrucosum HKI 0517]DAA73623.1 TPA_exp: putative Proline utilization protein PrnX [Trichophyton benhamiae CBS 112371]
MLVLRESDVAPMLQQLTLEECHRLLQALWRSLAAYSASNAAASGGSEAGSVHQPMRESIRTADGSTTLFMPASDTTTTTGIKVVTLPGAGGPPAGAIALFSPKSGQLEGILNAEMITAFRTALASMIPFHLFQLPQTQGQDGRGNRLLVFGAGKQAEWHIRLGLLLAPSIASVTVVNRGRGGLDRLRASLGDVAAARSDVSFVYISREEEEEEEAKYEGRLRAAVSEADAIFCCTPSTEPLFPYSYLLRQHAGGEGEDSQERKRRFVSMIGSFRPHMHEVDTDTLLSGQTLLVDSRQACLAEAGELITAGVRPEQLTEIGELSPASSLFASSSSSNVVFKCVGMGIMDLAVGRELLCLASERGIGVPIQGF